MVEGKVDTRDLKFSNDIKKIEEKVKSETEQGGDWAGKLEERLQVELNQELRNKMDQIMNGEVKKLNENVDEKLEIEKRRCNIIIHGVKEEVVLKL